MSLRTIGDDLHREFCALVEDTLNQVEAGRIDADFCCEILEEVAAHSDFQARVFIAARRLAPGGKHLFEFQTVDVDFGHPEPGVRFVIIGG